MRQILVYDEENKPIGYLLLDNQVYYPYTQDGKDLGKGFFNREHAEAHLRAFDRSHHPERRKAAEALT